MSKFGQLFCSIPPLPCPSLRVAVKRVHVAQAVAVRRTVMSLETHQLISSIIGKTKEQAGVTYPRISVINVDHRNYPNDNTHIGSKSTESASIGIGRGAHVDEYRPMRTYGGRKMRSWKMERVGLSFRARMEKRLIQLDAYINFNERNRAPRGIFYRCQIMKEVQIVCNTIQPETRRQSCRCLLPGVLSRFELICRLPCFEQS
jgi:hypothetical protein